MIRATVQLAFSLIIASNILLAQTIITPTWFAPGVGYNSFVNSDCSKVMTNGAGCSVWDVKSGKRLFHFNTVGLTFSEKGDTLIGRSGDSLVLYDCNNGKHLKSLKVFNQYINRIVFNSTKNFMAFWVFQPSDLSAVVKVWNMKTEEVHVTLHTGHMFVTGVSFNTKGDKIFTTGHSDGAKMWDVETGDVLAKMEQTELFLDNHCFSKMDDKVCATNNTDIVRVWNTGTGKLISKIVQEKAKFQKALFDNAGEALVTVSSDLSLRIWNVKTGEMMKEIAKPALGNNYGVTFNRKGDIIYTLEDSTVKAYSYPEGNLLFNSKVSECSFMHLAISDDDAKVIVSDKCGYAKVLNALSGEVMLTLVGQLGGYLADFSDDGQKILISNYERAAKIWNTYNLEKHSFVRFQEDGEVSDFNGRLFVTTRKSGELFVYDIENTNLHYVIKGYGGGELKDARLSNTSGKIAYKNMQLGITIGDVVTGNVIYNLDQETEAFYFNFSPDDKYLIASSSDSTVKIWDLTTGLLKSQITTNGRFLNRLYINNQGNKALIGGGLRPTLYEVETGKKLVEYPLPKSSIFTLSFNKLGDKVIAGCEDGSATVWDSNTGKVLFTTNGHTSRLNVAKFNNRGDKLITGDFEGKIKLWSAINGELIAELKGHKGAILSAAFNLYDDKLITTDGSVALWDIGQFPVEVNDDNEERHDEEITIFPNPATNEIVITVPSEERCVECMVIDVNGNSTYAPVTYMNSNNQLKFNTNHLESGIYVLRITCSGKVYNKTFIVQK